MGRPGSDAALRRVRALCETLADCTERPSHGAPAWFVRGKHTFVMFADDHHGDGRLALWCAAPPDAQAMLVDSDPDVFFVPPYVGYLGWVGVRLDRKAPWAMVAKVIEEAYATRAAATTKAKAGRRRSPPARRRG